MSGTIEELIGTERGVGIPINIPQGTEVYPTEPGPQPGAIGGGGGITVKPWWEKFPSDVGGMISGTLATPIVSPIGLFKAPVKTVIKYGGGALLGFGGFLLGSLFGGGGQQQQQDITQIPTVTPTVTPIVIPTVIPTIEPTITPTIEPNIYAPGARDITQYMTTNTITHNIQETHTTTITPTKTITYTVTGASQEAEQKGGLDLFSLAIVGILGLVGFSMFKKGG